MEEVLGCSPPCSRNAEESGKLQLWPSADSSYHCSQVGAFRCRPEASILLDVCSFILPAGVEQRPSPCLC